MVQFAGGMLRNKPCWHSTPADTPLGPAYSSRCTERPAIERRRKKRRGDYKTNRDPAEHPLIDSMPIAPRPAGTVMETAITAAEVQSTTGKAL